MPKLVKCPLCGGTGTIAIPFDGSKFGVSRWWIIPHNGISNTRRITQRCPFCEIGNSGRVRADVAAAFTLIFGEAQWITCIDFNEFMLEIGAMRERQ